MVLLFCIFDKGNCLKAIKLTDNMQEREYTKCEIAKLEKCIQFLKDEGIIDEDGVVDLLEI